MFDFPNLFNKKSGVTILKKEEIAKLLKTTPEALDAFESTYAKQILPDVSDNFFEVNSRQAVAMLHQTNNVSKCPQTLIERIVNELLAQTSVYHYQKDTSEYIKYGVPNEPFVMLEEILAVPEKDRPQLAGNLIKRDITEDSNKVLLYYYSQFLKEKNKKKKEQFYHMFRQGLDILDLDPITYEIIGANPNSMGYWLPAIADAVNKQDFFKIPETTVIKVPMPLLQLTRIEYESLTPATVKILNQFCQKVFSLDVNKDYFIKTGTYSSKFDFRNAHVTAGKEVSELGEYLMFVHHQALQMASPLAHPCIYGVSTTNEWVVREYIPNNTGKPCIYKGLPLRTEYRVFVDFNTNDVIGINPYWDPQVMKQRFGHANDADSPHNKHDYIIYQMQEEQLMAEYDANKDIVAAQIKAILQDIDLQGQWSADIMQVGNDFYLIDMALAANSALNHCVPKELLKPIEENWLPEI